MVYTDNIDKWARKTLIAASSVPSDSDANTLMGMWVLATAKHMSFHDMRVLASTLAKEAADSAAQYNHASDTRIRYGERAARRTKLANVLAACTVKDPTPEQLAILMLEL